MLDALKQGVSSRVASRLPNLPFPFELPRTLQGQSLKRDVMCCARLDGRDITLCELEDVLCRLWAIPARSGNAAAGLGW